MSHRVKPSQLNHGVPGGLYIQSIYKKPNKISTDFSCWVLNFPLFFIFTMERWIHSIILFQQETQQIKEDRMDWFAGWCSSNDNLLVCQLVSHFAGGWVVLLPSTAIHLPLWIGGKLRSTSLQSEKPCFLIYEPLLSDLKHSVVL